MLILIGVPGGLAVILAIGMPIVLTLAPPPTSASSPPVNSDDPGVTPEIGSVTISETNSASFNYQIEIEVSGDVTYSDLSSYGVFVDTPNGTLINRSSTTGPNGGLL